YRRPCELLSFSRARGPDLRDDSRRGLGRAGGLGCRQTWNRPWREGQSDRGGGRCRRRWRRGATRADSAGISGGMRWVSRRGAAPAVPFMDALVAGTAPDGGLYMPERLDPLSPDQLAAIRVAAGDIVEIGTIVGSHLLRDEISVTDMRAL